MKEELTREKNTYNRMSNKMTSPIFLSPSKGLGEKTGGRAERMPILVATGTGIGIRPSLFSSGCL